MDWTRIVCPVFLSLISATNAYCAVDTSGVVRPYTSNKSTTLPASNVSLNKKMAAGAPQESLQGPDVYIKLLKENPANADASLALADYYLYRHLDLYAFNVIKRALIYHPSDVRLLTKLGEIQILLHAFPSALVTFTTVLSVDPQNQAATEYWNAITAIAPRFAYGLNEFGISSDNTYVSGINSVWDYSSMYYSRDTSYGRLSGRVNFASRDGFNAAQYEIDYSPAITRNISFDLIAAFANQPLLFANETWGGQININLTDSWQTSGGARYARVAGTYFTTYIAALNYAVGNWWFSFSPYYFIPQSNLNSALFTGTIKRYFTTEDHSLTLAFGAGHSPNLADLLTIDFIVIKNDFVNLTYEFPVLEHKVVFDIGGGYQRWAFPAGGVNNLYDINVGMKYRF